MNSTYDRLTGLLATGFGIEAGEVTPESTFEDLELDSLALVELALATQEKFGVSLSEDDLRTQSTLAEAAEVVDAKQASA
ncbi:acyl carrier protein [Streptomyces daliensis]|uniref:Acyl carrier protein n=1 Tax=Streptomyces daliensis TaxID=299421 RepID=A0A8T4J190_9ACTN|nr:acyl carrier protein [Streptomyces daliensis]